MSRYMPTFSRKTTFDGDEVTAVFKQVPKSLMMQASELVEMRDGKAQPRSDVSVERTMKHVDDVVRDSLNSLSGLKDSEGNAISIETVLRDSYFIDLVQWAYTQATSGSTLTEGDAKN